MAERFLEISHFHGDGVFGNSYRSSSRPRLMYTDTCYRKTRTVERKWFVDHSPIEPAEIEGRLAADPMFDAEEIAILKQLSEDWIGHDRMKEIDFIGLLRLARRGAVEAENGMVRLWRLGDIRWPYAYPAGVR